MFARFILGLATFIGIAAGGLFIALIGSFFVYFGWNYGLVPACSPAFHTIDLLTAMWVSLLLSTVGSRFHSHNEQKEGTKP